MLYILWVIYSFKIIVQDWLNDYKNLKRIIYPNIMWFKTIFWTLLSTQCWLISYTVVCMTHKALWRLEVISNTPIQAYTNLLCMINALSALKIIYTDTWIIHYDVTDHRKIAEWKHEAEQNKGLWKQGFK